MYVQEKNNHITISQLISKSLIFFIISIIIFYPFNPRYILYMVVMVGIWCVLLLNYHFKSNGRFYCITSIFSVSNLIALALTKQVVHQTMHIDWVNIIICVVYAFMLVVMIGRCFYNIKNQVNYKSDDKILFIRRRYDLERIQQYIESQDVIGVNGIWGSGKSFLIARLKELLNESKRYIFINVDLLSCNLDELQTMLLNEMEKALTRHKIVPTHSIKLKRMLQEKAIYRYLHMLFMQNDMSYSEALDGFIQEISLMDETIVIVYEDIDRISNVDTVKKIFSISEKLASEHIKIIYQYEESNLSKLGLDRNYLEKYIPFVVNLTPIKFIEIVENVLEEEKIDGKLLGVKDFNHLTSQIYTDHYLEMTLGIKQSLSINMGNTGIRKVKEFIKELIIILEEKEQYNSKKYKSVVISFYFVKHFFETLYSSLSLEEGLLDAIKFEYQEKKYTILELIAMGNRHQENSRERTLSKEDIDTLFKMAENKEKLFLLSLFKYDLDVNNIKNSYTEVTKESIRNINKKASNEKKDRLIWNLLCNGKSEYTDYETAVHKFIEDVLSKPKNEQKDAYKIFLEDLYYERYKKKDNRTIFKLGITPFISLFQAFQVCNVGAREWKQVINFYFEYTKKDQIDIEVIQILNYCNLDERVVYLEILKKFNNLKVNGNMNVERSYKHFLKKYLQVLASLGYADTSELWRLDAPENIALREKDVVDAVKYIRSDISKIRDRIDIKMIRQDLDIITVFIDKNIQIVSKKEVLEASIPRMHTEFSSKYIHQEEFDRLFELYKTVGKECFMEEIRISYEKTFISAYEVNDLLELCYFESE